MEPTIEDRGKTIRIGYWSSSWYWFDDYFSDDVNKMYYITGHDCNHNYMNHVGCYPGDNIGHCTVCNAKCPEEVAKFFLFFWRLKAC